jgi:hypothetical protein
MVIIELVIKGILNTLHVKRGLESLFFGSMIIPLTLCCQEYLLYGNKGSYVVMFGSWDSAVDIATGYRLDDQGGGVQVPVGSRIFSSPRHLGCL